MKHHPEGGEDDPRHGKFRQLDASPRDAAGRILRSLLNAPLRLGEDVLPRSGKMRLLLVLLRGDTSEGARRHIVHREANPADLADATAGRVRDFREE